MLGARAGCEHRASEPLTRTRPQRRGTEFSAVMEVDRTCRRQDEAAGGARETRYEMQRKCMRGARFVPPLSRGRSDESWLMRDNVQSVLLSTGFAVIDMNFST